MKMPGPRSFVCSHKGCGKSYSSNTHLKRHLQIHQDKLKCNIEGCDKVFVSKENLNKHVDNVHFKKNPKKYKCGLCPEEFNKHSWLLRHMFYHTGDMPYACSMENCGKKFLVPSKLKRHLRTHEGHACPKPNCNEKFTKWVLLVKHIKIAHPKIYKCCYCEKEFTTSYNLKAHSEIHELNRTVYLCPVPHCNRFYTMKRNLTYHLKKYHDKRPFQCNICHKWYKTEDDLQTHQSRHDPKKRLKRKRRKKPNFAAEIAGLVRKENISKVSKGQKEQYESDSSLYTIEYKSGSENTEAEMEQNLTLNSKNIRSQTIKCKSEKNETNLSTLNAKASEIPVQNFEDKEFCKVNETNNSGKKTDDGLSALLKAIDLIEKKVSEIPSKQDLIASTA